MSIQSDGRGDDGEPAETVAQPLLPTLLTLGNLHSEVGIADGLYKDGHYDDAARKASQRFVNRVQELADRPDLDGVGLMNSSSSEQSPILEFNDRETIIERDTHNGYRFLAVGLTQAVRNVLIHQDHYGLDAVRALEWLAFISAMHRRLDEAQQIPQQPPEVSA